MKIDDLTIGQAKQLIAQFGGMSAPATASVSEMQGLNCMIGQKVIVRTYSAGVWFGTLEQKSGNEVILTGARRMWRWWADKSISLSGVALHGIKQEKSKICEPLPSQWLEAIEITPCSDKSIKSIEGAPIVQAQ